MWDFKLYLSSFKTKRATKIAEMYVEDLISIIFIKKGKIVQTIENQKTEEKISTWCTLDFLIDRFKRCDQRRKATRFYNWIFTDFGLGFMYGIYFQNLWTAKNINNKDEERLRYYKTLLFDLEDFLI